MFNIFNEKIKPFMEKIFNAIKDKFNSFLTNNNTNKVQAILNETMRSKMVIDNAVDRLAIGDKAVNFIRKIFRKRVKVNSDGTAVAATVVDGKENSKKGIGGFFAKMINFILKVIVYSVLIVFGALVLYCMVMMIPYIILYLAMYIAVYYVLNFIMKIIDIILSPSMA